MDLTVGAIVEGKVTGITKFGAFVALPENKSGMVHISEVASSFVNDIKDFLQEGQQVKVRFRAASAAFPAAPRGRAARPCTAGAEGSFYHDL